MSNRTVSLNNDKMASFLLKYDMQNSFFAIAEKIKALICLYLTQKVLINRRLVISTENDENQAFKYNIVIKIYNHRRPCHFLLESTHSFRNIKIPL